MKRLFILAVLAAAFCVGAQAQEKLYTVKSGIVTMEMDMMGQKVTQQMYFDDYGVKQATVGDFGGRKSRNIVVDGSTVMVNDDEKTAMKMPMMGQQERVNFSNLDEKAIKKYKVKELGTETVAGKECKKYEVTLFMMGQPQKQTVWVYKGITLKSESKSDFGSMNQTAVKVEENVEIPASMFVVPEGVKIEEMNMGMMGGGW
ncbi:MAG: DUF4412 domain-containing protein [Bacteroidales bacterium]|nr:DUF4412 domain-containing protein [Bacteroidales bacterium]